MKNVLVLISSAAHPALNDGAIKNAVAVLQAQGATCAEARKAAFTGRIDDPALSGYVNDVRRHAYRITDQDVQRTGLARRDLRAQRGR